jgi:hypothetical protein
MFKQNNIIKLNTLNNFNINLKSIITKKLTKNEIRAICLLKDEEWTYGIRSQLDWFKNNIQQLEKVWKIIEEERITGYEHRAPNKKPKKEPFKPFVNTNESHGCLLKFNKRTLLA